MALGTDNLLGCLLDPFSNVANTVSLARVLYG
jgi:hypothetical protein